MKSSRTKRKCNIPNKRLISTNGNCIAHKGASIGTRYAKAMLRYDHTLSNHERKRIEFTLEKMNAELVAEGTYPTLDIPHFQETGEQVFSNEIDYQIYRIDVTGYEYADMIGLLQSVGMELYTEIGDGKRSGRGTIGTLGTGREGKKYSHGKEIRKIVRSERKALTVIMYNAIKNLTSFASDELDCLLASGQIIVNADGMPIINPAFIGPFPSDFADTLVSLMRIVNETDALQTARGKARELPIETTSLFAKFSEINLKIQRNINNGKAIISALGDEYTDEQANMANAMIEKINDENKQLRKELKAQMNAKTKSYAGIVLTKEQLPMQDKQQSPYVAESDRYSVYGEYDDSGRVISLITVG